MSTVKLIALMLISLLVLNLISWANLVVVSAQTPPDLSGAQVPASCKKIGVNSAAFFAQGDPFYQKAKNAGMGWTIEIARADAEGVTVDGINRALANGLTPIIRIGVGSTSYGFINPANYVSFLNSVAARANGPFYAVAGPNEPEYEHWLAQENANDPSADYNIGDQRNPNQAGINRLGALLSNYMNAVINGGVDSKVSLLSPSLSVTAWSTVPIITAMKNNGADFSALAGFSGTAYSGNLGPADTRTQIDKITEALDLPIIFTEFQDGAANIATLKAIIDVVKADSNVKAALLFNAFNSNTGWSQFSLTDAELTQVLGAECVNLAELAKIVRPQRTSVPCQDTTNPEFNPLRPYPGNPCDPLIPRSDPRADREAPKSNQSWVIQLAQDYQMRNSVAFSCGNSLTPTVIHAYDKGSRKDIGPECTVSGRTVRCVRRENFTLTLDLTDANLPILGNTQNQGLTDAQKMTEYLSWYLNGVVQHSEQDANPSINRLVNFSGPLQKLLPAQLKEFIKDELLNGPAGQAFIPPSGGGQYHNYLVDDPTRLKDPAASLWEQIFRNVPFASLEDTTGEVVISVSDIEAHNQQDKDVIDAITPNTPLKLTIRKNAAP